MQRGKRAGGQDSGCSNQRRIFQPHDDALFEGDVLYGWNQLQSKHKMAFTGQDDNKARTRSMPCARRSVIHRRCARRHHQERIQEPEAPLDAGLYIDGHHAGTARYGSRFALSGGAEYRQDDCFRGVESAHYHIVVSDYTRAEYVMELGSHRQCSERHPDGYQEITKVGPVSLQQHHRRWTAARSAGTPRNP